MFSAFVTHSFPVPSTYRSDFQICRKIYRPAFHRHRRILHMSGVNGGIDYDIDLSKLPEELSERIQYVQQGPDSPTELISAAEQIAASSQENPQILPVLVDMLGYNNPVAANIAIDALVAGKDASIPSLLTGVAAFNYSVNAYALRALARIADPTVLGVCLACARDGPIPNVRRAACRALAGLQYETTEDAHSAYRCLLALADQEPDWGVRYASLAALESFASTDLIDEIILEDGLHVALAASEGKSQVSKEAEKRKQEKESKSTSEIQVTVDATVKARAAVAYDTMVKRMKALQKI